MGSGDKLIILVEFLDVWKLATFIFVPIWVGGTGLFVYLREQEHAAHHVRKEYQEFAHMGIRSKVSEVHM